MPTGPANPRRGGVADRGCLQHHQHPASDAPGVAWTPLESTFGASLTRCKNEQDAATARLGGSITTTPRRSIQRSPVVGAVPPWRGGELPSTSYRLDTTGDTTASWASRAFDPPPRAVRGEMTLDHEAPRWCCVRRCDRLEAGPSCVRERSRCRPPLETSITPPRRRAVFARRRASDHDGGGRFRTASSQRSRAKEAQAACHRRGVGPAIAHGGLQGTPGHGPARRSTAAARGRTTGANVRRFALPRMRRFIGRGSGPS